jgi:hypothetical protein
VATQGQVHIVSIDPIHVRGLGSWTEDDLAFELDDLDLPAQPQWHRCGAVHCIDRGPWIGTLVCCVRTSGHDGGHTMALGDAGGPDHWQEIWY